MALRIRPLASYDSIPDLTRLLHRAYAELGRMGFNYTAVDQDDRETQARVDRGECLLAIEEGRVVGTVTLYAPGCSDGCDWYRRADVAALGQFGVEPEAQGQGVGTLLLRAAEYWAVQTGAFQLALDTSAGAEHLVAWYGREGFAVVERVQWTGKTYRSVIMSKRVRVAAPAAGAEG